MNCKRIQLLYHSQSIKLSFFFSYHAWRKTGTAYQLAFEKADSACPFVCVDATHDDSNEWWSQITCHPNRLGSSCARKKTNQGKVKGINLHFLFRFEETQIITLTLDFVLPFLLKFQIRKYFEAFLWKGTISLNLPRQAQYINLPTQSTAIFEAPGIPFSKTLTTLGSIFWPMRARWTFFSLISSQ